MSDAPRTVGVIGAGVMGAGIAQLSALAGSATLVCDRSEALVAAALDRIAADLARNVGRGRLRRAEAEAARARLQPVAAIGDLDGAELVIEAVPEQLETKGRVLAEIPGDPVVATNTSSLSVTAIAARAPRPERVVGMHFFNPPQRMRLVEVIAGARTDPTAVATALATARAMGRTPILARDAIGFVANRAARPFYSEALRIADEGLASPAQIDRICRIGGRFRMGPFELMDLVGLDTGLAVADSFTRQSIGEPRWKPSHAQRRLVVAQRLGRKTGQGFFAYGDDRSRQEEPVAAANGDADAVPQLSIVGEGPDAQGLRQRAAKRRIEAAATRPDLVVVTDRADLGSIAPDVPLAISCASASLAAAERPGAVGFAALPPIESAALIELTRLPWTSPESVGAAERMAQALGFEVEWVDDGPGLVLGRIVAQLVNEGCFAVGEGVASPDDVDLATTLGFNHPHGPVAWGERIGWRAVRARIDGLWNERHEERYRLAPMLHRAAACGVSVRQLVPAGAARGVWT